MVWIAALFVAALGMGLLAHRRRSMGRCGQSPGGKWACKTAEESVYLELRAPDDAARSGTFIRVTDQAHGTTHEAGSWIHEDERLRLMIFAYDGPGNIALGTVQVFRVHALDVRQLVLEGEGRSLHFQWVGPLER